MFRRIVSTYIFAKRFYHQLSVYDFSHYALDWFDLYNTNTTTIGGIFFKASYGDAPRDHSRECDPCCLCGLSLKVSNSYREGGCGMKQTPIKWLAA